MHSQAIMLLLFICLSFTGIQGATSSPSPGQSAYQVADAFLREYMPLRDTVQLSEDFIANNIQAALSARNSSRWAASIPHAIFLDYVLPYASMDEDRDGCRHSFRPLVRPLVEGAQTAGEAALLVNKRLWSLPGVWNITFKPNQTPDIMSPTQVARAGHASCTGMSIFLVCALRSVGIPARVTGTPAWRKGKPGVKGGNHDWVEVFDEGVWSFTGPAEWTDKGWNHTWFYPEPASHQRPRDRRHSIFATSWRTTRDGTFPLEWAPEVNYVNAVDVTESYSGPVAVMPLA